MTPEQFLQRNYKWFALAFLVLFLFKSVQSCNRNMSKTITEKQYIHTIDSLNKKINVLDKDCNNTIEKLKFELALEKEKAGAANQRAEAIQSVAEKLKSNTTTTVNVRGATVDTTKNKK